MVIQKKVLPFLGIFVLTHNTICAGWLDDLKQTATKAWDENKGQIQQYVDPAKAALKNGVQEYNSTKSLSDAAKSAQDTFQTDLQKTQQQGTIQQQAQQKLTQFTALQHATTAQKTALNGLYQQQQYQAVVTVIDQTNDIFAMLGRTSDAVKKQRESDLAQMGIAFSQVTLNTIATITQNVYTYVKAMAPPAPPAPAAPSMTDAELEAKINAIVDKKYGALVKKIQDMSDQQSNNMFFNNPAPASTAPQNMFG
ncbi:MAG TPA: hypothetical protein DIC42_00900 [Holosporales bacterium]|nr:hypothetical protein [Holosporales bacterium]